MRVVENVLNKILDLKTDSISNEQLYTSNEQIICLIVAPHSGTNNRWMIRFSTVSAFDRWANSCAIEKFFDTKDDLIKYITENQLNIYKQLLKYLSLEYDELVNQTEN